MTKTKVMSERDKQVQVRNSMLEILDNGCSELTNARNRELLANTIKCIGNEMNGFSVVLNTDDVYEFFGDDYTGKEIIIIKEDDKEIIAVLQLKSGQCAGEWRAYELNPSYFEYDEQIEAEYRWERDAESAYERYLDAKCIHDDPRGQ